MNVALLGPVRQLLASGQPTRGLLSSLDPDDQLPWALDYLTMVAGVADALCRLRDRRDRPPPLLPALLLPLARRRSSCPPPPSSLLTPPVPPVPPPPAPGESTMSSRVCCQRWTRPPGRSCSGMPSATSSSPNPSRYPHPHCDPHPHPHPHPHPSPSPSPSPHPKPGTTSTTSSSCGRAMERAGRRCARRRRWSGTYCSRAYAGARSGRCAPSGSRAARCAGCGTCTGRRHSCSAWARCYHSTRRAHYAHYAHYARRSTCH